MKHERILTENVATLRKRTRQLEAETRQLQAENERLQKQLQENRRLQAEVRQLKKENLRYSTQLQEQQRRNLRTDVGSALPPYTESTSRYARHRPSSPAPSATHAAHIEDVSDRYYGRNPQPGVTSLRRNMQPQLSIATSAQRTQRPPQALNTTQRRSFAQQSLRNTVPKTRPTEQAIDPRRFQSSRVNARRRDSNGFGTGAYATNLLRGTMLSGGHSTRRQTQPNKWQERVSVLPRPSATPDLMRRAPRRENDGSGVNPVTPRKSRRWNLGYMRTRHTCSITADRYDPWAFTEWYIIHTRQVCSNKRLVTRPTTKWY